MAPGNVRGPGNELGARRAEQFSHHSATERGGEAACGDLRSDDNAVTERLDLLSWQSHVWAVVGSHRWHVYRRYHPPRPLYTPDSLLDYIKACIDEITHSHPAASLVLGGDFNQLSHDELVERTGLTQIVKQQTRGANVLDRIYVLCPLQYDTVRVVKSVVRSDHQAVVASTASQPVRPNKQKLMGTHRKITPTQHAIFLQYILNHEDLFENHTDTLNTQSEFDLFYNIATVLLDAFYPQSTVTFTSRDLHYMTAAIKSKLRCKNRLMRAGRVEEANSLAEHIGKDITRRCEKRLSLIDGRVYAKSMWAAVRQQDTPQVYGVTAESLNEHYGAISTDSNYQAPARKQSVAQSQSNLSNMELTSEWRMF